MPPELAVAAAAVVAVVACRLGIAKVVSLTSVSVQQSDSEPG